MDREHFQRADQAHVKALDWIAGSIRPLLFLTGASGSGKSSLLSAHVIPHLREGQPATRVITLRSFDDPLVMLREQLLTPEVIWQKPPKVDGDMPLLELLQDACEYLDKRDERLLLDQFEELLILHEKPESTPGEEVDKAKAGPAIIEAVRQFLHSALDQPLPGLCVLLSLRTDYEGMLSRLELPPLEQGKNRFIVSPFELPAARDFLAGGFKEDEGESGMSELLLDRTMKEAEAIEELHGLIRPITLNMLGVVLRRKSGAQSNNESPGGLLETDLRKSMNLDVLRDHAPQFLDSLLTRAGKRRARSVGDMATETELESHVVEGCLLGLSDRGLVRRLNRAPQLADRVWEISHDFAARLIVLILHTPQRSIWQRLRPIALPASIAIWLLVFTIMLPGYIGRIQLQVAEQLESEHGVRADREEGKGWIVTLMSPTISEHRPRYGEIGRLLHGLGKIDSLRFEATKISYNGEMIEETLLNVDWLQGLNGLRSLDLSGCAALENVNGLRGLGGLESLVLRNCFSLKDIRGLRGLTGLQTLDLSECKALTRVDGLSGLTELRTLNLYGSYALTNVDGLQGLQELRKLDLRSSQRIAGLKPLHQLKSLQRVGLNSLNEQITEEQISALKQALPRVVVVFDDLEDL